MSDVAEPVASHQTVLNGPVVDYGPYEAVAVTIARRALAYPDRPATECNGQTRTFAQLMARAGAIAEALLAAGAAPNDCVALCMSRSTDTQAALLGILMAGCAYVPLDLRYPAERIETAVSNSEAKVLLSDRVLPVQIDAKRLLLTEIGTAPIGGVAAYPSGAHDLAYVIYTSGSTGKPKGVGVQQCALRNLLYSIEREPGMTADDTLVAVTTISFDIATLEMLLPALLGAKLVIATEEEARDSVLLLPLLRRSHATLMQATPGAWRALIDAGWDGNPAMKVISGGEPMSRDLANQLLARSPSVWNCYGPTETTIYSSVTHIFPGDKTPAVDTVMANTQFYVLDAEGRSLPPEEEGELCIGGVGLARGYLKMPELTAEKFFANPFGPGLLYRSGDAARYRTEGGIHLLGRIDSQVKVRGYRIELGEIEKVLERNQAVREAVVVHQSSEETADRPAISRLVAYVDAPAHASGDAKEDLMLELEQACAAVLPEYMLASAIVPLAGFPRLLNGKINRRELPDVFAQAGGLGVGKQQQPFVAPTDFLERQLADIWRTTLHLPNVSIRASFFSLGVKSLSALRMITKVNRTFAMDLGLASLITHPTIESIATLIREKHDAGEKRAVVAIRSEGSLPPLFLLHGVGGNIISFFGLAARLGEDQPVYAIQSQALLSGTAALLRIEDMAAFYIRDLRRVQAQGPYRLLGYSFGGTVAVEMAHQLRAAGDEVSLLAMLDSRTLAFEAQHRNTMSVGTQVNRRFERLAGNTMTLGWKDRATYIAKKLATRGVRFTCRVLLRVGVHRLPSMLKDANEINLVALDNYVLKPYAGKLVLFRAAEQDFAEGPRDLGWAPWFAEGVEIHEIEGDHERIFLEPAVDSLAAAMKATLQTVQA